MSINSNLFHSINFFFFCRLFKEPEAELGVLITKKVQRDRRTSGYVIAYIEPAGLVDKDGRFKVGDELINVNGQSLRGLSMEAARNVLRQLSGHVDIIVARQPQEATKLPNSGKYTNQSNQLGFSLEIMSALSVLLGILITKIKHRNIFHIIIKHFDFQL